MDALKLDFVNIMWPGLIPLLGMGGGGHTNWAQERLTWSQDSKSLIHNGKLL